MSSLYVGNLAWSTEAEALQAHLEAQAGVESGSILKVDCGTQRAGRTRGWAIVDCSTEEAAENIISCCNGTELDSRDLVVRPDSKPDGSSGGSRGRGGGGGGRGSNSSYGRGRGGGSGGDPQLEGKPENSSGFQVVVRNLPWSVTTDMLRGTFEQIGAVAEAQVVCHADSGRSKGWGTVRFKSADDAADAIARFGGVELAGRPMTVMMDRYN